MTTTVTEKTADARQPKRERGRQRVEALLNAAAEIIALHGYQGATMTEIASRAGAPIGSLYQFFPRKSCLAKELVSRFRDHIEQALKEIEADAPSLSAEQMATRLIQVMVSLEIERRCVGELLQAQDTPVECQENMRRTLRASVQETLQAFAPSLDDADAEIKAVAIANMMKATVWLEQEQHQRSAQNEWINILAVYLSGLR